MKIKTKEINCIYIDEFNNCKFKPLIFGSYRQKCHIIKKGLCNDLVKRFNNKRRK